MKMRLGLAVVVLVAAVACKPGGDDDDSGSPVTAASACAEYADGVCSKYGACFPWYIPYVFGDVATCKARFLIGCEDGFSATGTSLTPQKAHDCVQAWSGQTCAQWLTETTPAACEFGPGTRANGASCSSPSECASSACYFSTGDCGTCTTEATAGQPCAATACADGLACVDGTCVTPGAAGASCDDTHPCKSGLACKSGTCGDFIPAGGTCNPNEYACATNTQLLYCDSATSACKAVQFAAAGQPCGALANGVTWCASSGSCKYASGPEGTCQAAAADGAACNGSTGTYCLYPAACEGGVCKLPSANACE